jgi:hypothetical protein
MSRTRNSLVYLGLTGAAVAAFLAIRTCGEGLATRPDDPASGPATAQTSPDTLLHVLLALVVIILVARVMAVVLGRLGQPPVIGEILAGIMLGPSLLGRVAPDGSGFLFPPSILPLLGVLAQIGVILYMFLVGLRLDMGQLRERTSTSIAVSHASIVAPFLLGAALVEQRVVHGLRAVHRRVDVGHRVPGARADPDRPRAQHDRAGRDRAGLCRRR